MLSSALTVALLLLSVFYTANAYVSLPHKLTVQKSVFPSIRNVKAQVQPHPTVGFGSPVASAVYSYNRKETALGAASAGAAEAGGNDNKPATAERVVPRKTLKKVLPLGLMLFFILFNYTILRDTKDVLVVTAPNSGAEIIPFLKTYVNLPSAIGFTILYSSLCNKMPTDKVFYFVMSAFLSFFAAFAGIICKFHHFLVHSAQC